MKSGMRVIAVCVILLTGCYSSNNNTDVLRERTADATAVAKRNAQAIAKGIVEGLERKGPININGASAKDLQKLPGITPDTAQVMIAGRPYDDPAQLVRKHILAKSQYNRIRAQIVAKSFHFYLARQPIRVPG